MTASVAEAMATPDERDAFEGMWLGETGARHLPFIPGIYERGLSLNVMTKSFGLPGLRIGWIARQDAAIISKMARFKHDLSFRPTRAFDDDRLAHQGPYSGP